MVTRVDYWKDSKGKAFPTRHEALLSEIEIALGRTGNGEGLVTPGIARLIADNRVKLRELLEEFDATAEGGLDLRKLGE